MTTVWDVASVDPATLTYAQGGSVAAGTLPPYHFVAGVLDILIPASMGPFRTTSNYIDVAVEDPTNTIPNQGKSCEVIAEIDTTRANPGDIMMGLHYQLTGGGNLYFMVYPGLSSDGSDPPASSGSGVQLMSTNGLEWAAGRTEWAATADATAVWPPSWVRLVVDDSLVFTAELWASDPTAGGSPVASAGPIDPGILGAVAGDPRPCMVSRMDPGVSVPVDNFLKVTRWFVNQGPLPPPTGADSITCAASPDAIVADGSQQSVLTATVLDTDGNPLPAETVVFTADSATAGAAGTCSPTTNHHNGIYTAKYTDTATAGDVTITATDGALSAKCVIHQTPTATGNVGFGPPQVGIVRQGRS